MPVVSADELIGQALYAKRHVPLLANPKLDSRVLKIVQPGELVGIIENYAVQKQGDPFWYFGVPDPVRGYPFEAYVPYDSSALDVPRLAEDYRDSQEATRRRNLEWWERLAEDGTSVVHEAATGAGMVLTIAGIGLGYLAIRRLI